MQDNASSGPASVRAATACSTASQTESSALRTGGRLDVGKSGEQFARRKVRTDRLGHARVHLLQCPATEWRHLQLRTVSRGGAELDQQVEYHREGLTVLVAIDGEERIGGIRILEDERFACALPKLDD
jgi:hypothetical protein